MESPSYYEEVSKKLLSDLGIDFEKFYTAYDFDYFKNRKLDTGFYFDKATYGVSRIVKNVPSFRYDLTYKESIKPDNIQKVASQLPISDQSKEEFIRLFNLSFYNPLVELLLLCCSTGVGAMSLIMSRGGHETNRPIQETAQALKFFGSILKTKIFENQNM